MFVSFRALVCLHRKFDTLIPDQNPIMAESESVKNLCAHCHDEILNLEAVKYCAECNKIMHKRDSCGIDALGAVICGSCHEQKQARNPDDEVKHRRIT